MKLLQVVELTPPEQRHVATKILETDRSHDEKAYALNYVMNNNLFRIAKTTDTEIIILIPHSNSCRKSIVLERIW